jgi:hypothetical protein
MIEKSGVELLNRSRPTQGCRVDRRRIRLTRAERTAGKNKNSGKDNIWDKTGG